MTTARFAEFIDIFNAGQDRATPAVHRTIADWLDARAADGSTRLCLMAFRNAGKSSLVGLYCAWLLARRPDLRILVVAADHALAAAMVGNVKAIIGQHPLTAGLKPARASACAHERFTVARPTTLREPSMLAKGLSANLTGSRADVVICDDVEVPNTADTVAKCAQLRRKLAEIDYVLVPGGTQLYVGTPHTLHSIYSDRAQPELGEEAPFLNGFATLRLPLVDSQGNSAWPERFPQATIEALRRRTGPAKFASQMALEPVPVTAGHLDPDRLVAYTGEPAYGEVQGRSYLALGATRLVSASCAWDPAYGGEARRDRSVLAIVFVDGQGTYYLHRCLYLDRGPRGCDAAQAPDDDAPPEAVRQCRQVAAAVRNFHLPAVRLETNGVGRFVPDLLRRELVAQGLSAAVIAEASHLPKDRRILAGLDAPLAAGALHAHTSVFDTPLLREMREWRPGPAGPAATGGDDGLDALAAALLAEPVRLRRPQAQPRPQRDWRPGQQPGQARTQFRP